MTPYIYTQTYHAPYGDLLLGGYNGKLCLCDWQTEKHHEKVLGRLQRELHATVREQSEWFTARKDVATDVLQQTSQQLDEYFRKERQAFDIPLLFVGTDFQKTVWQALQTIPYGATVSYKDLAKQIGMPKSVRAVANANGANSISIILPCHRVIGSSGTLTGYGGGLAVKQYLLQLEQNILF